MKRSNEEILMASFRERCRENGFRVTPKRVLIYETLVQSKDHPSPETLFRRLRSQQPALSLDTVYRTLATFHDMGLVDIVEGSSLTKRFDPNQEHHHHLRCQQCQCLVDFQSQTFDQLSVPPVIHRSFRVQRVRVTVEGLCAKCQTKQPSNY